jgi:CheY-like chemotaxis protein
MTSESAARRRVLVVDDNRDAAESLEMLLQLLGYDSRAACNGREALALAPEYRPDIVLIDLGMPGMDGYEVARALRAMAGFDEVLLVALTGYGSEEDRRLTRDAGIDRHLIKPVDLAALQSVLATPGTARGPAPPAAGPPPTAL